MRGAIGKHMAHSGNALTSSEKNRTITAARRRERRTMDEYITPNYKTIGTVEQRKIRELYTSSLLNAFTQQDYLDAIALIGRVIDRLEKLEK